ncbi:putative mitochondrial protein AtMg00240 [Nicotiana tabacum]|uniref:Mitochondrial protein AtMg00240 n=1 Tax=Nicotiana tabacum TaxID=4097 RepID=A0AC58RPG0_TOBAC
MVVFLTVVYLLPLDPNEKLRAKEGASLPRKLVGKLNFLTNTRLDLAFSVQNLSQFMQEHREPHLKVVFHSLRYLKSDPTLGIFLSNDSDCSLKGYCDSNWATCADSRRSVTGYIVLLGNSPICWKSKKQEIVSLSIDPCEKLLVN